MGRILGLGAELVSEAAAASVVVWLAVVAWEAGKACELKAARHFVRTALQLVGMQRHCWGNR